MATPCPFPYPDVKRSDHVDVLHGQEIADPYRYLEDPDSPETQDFVTLQNKCTAHVFDKIPYQKELTARFTELYNYEKWSCPRKVGNAYFFYKNNGLQNQFVLYMQETADSSEASILLDPNTLAEDGTAALSATSFSEARVDPAQLYFAHGISRGGSDWQTIKILNVKTKKLLPDVVEWVKFSSIAWMHDDSGFFYSRFDAPTGLEESNCDDSKRGTETNANVHHQVWFHPLGVPDQTQDVLVYAYPREPQYYLSAEVSLDGQYLVVYLHDGCKNASMVHIASLDTFHAWSTQQLELHNNKTTSSFLPVIKIVDTMDASFDYLLNDGCTFWFQTNLNAPRNRVVKTDISAEPSFEWTEIIPEPQDQMVLQSALPAKTNLLVVKYLVDVKDILKIYTVEGKYVSEIPLPGLGTALVSCRRDSCEMFFKFISFTTPGTIVHIRDLAKPSDSEVFFETTVAGFNPSDFETKQVFYLSKDKTTKIPMFLVMKKNLPLTGMHATNIYGYGGFNISIKPSFSVFRLAWIQHFDGILAFPNLRGGGEYGEDWHQAGCKGQKQNVFDDFHAAAEYLIEEEYTVNSKISIEGGSNGGLLVAACANQRPDLYACALAAVGVLDSLRFHKFTCGHGWRSDYGDPDIASNFEYLLKYSPLHNIPSSSMNYPATLLTTGDHDDRVVPLHSLKFIAQLQHQQRQNPSPLLIRVETKAGHGAGKPTEKIIQEKSQVVAFQAWALGAEYHA